MRLYLSSFRMGNRSDQLLGLAGPGRRVAVIANAMDPQPAEERVSGVQREFGALKELGFDPEELDLRDYFLNPGSLCATLRRYDVVWLRGGNGFSLRYALARSGGDTQIRTLLEDDAIVYAGYSAGPCVLSPSLEGFELVDPLEVVQRMYGEPPIWEGLGILDFSFVPHFKSPGHPETEAIDDVVMYLQNHQIAYRTFRDGEVLTVDGATTTLFE
jgi:dipeptidase E